MTCECAVYFKLLLLCGYKDELQKYIDKALIEQDPLSDVVLELSTAGADDSKTLSVLNRYLLRVKDSDIDYNKVFDAVMSFLKEIYASGSMSMADITDLMRRLAVYTDRHFEEPWQTMYLMGDLFYEAEDAYIDKEDYQRKFNAFINDKICLCDYSPIQIKESFFKRLFRKMQRK